jgi:hypothetical protein
MGNSDSEDIRIFSKAKFTIFFSDKFGKIREKREINYKLWGAGLIILF